MTRRAELRALTLDNLPDAIATVNASSAGHTFAFDLDLFRFLVLSRFWQFSYPYSYVAYVDREPAGVLLNCANRAEGEAYSFYWGIAERFRRTRVAWEMAHEYLGRMRREGFLRTSADTATDSPVEIYSKLGYRSVVELLEMAAEDAPALRGGQSHEIRELAPAELGQVFSAEPERHWTATRYFVEGAGELLETIGAWRGGELAACVAATRFTGFTAVMFVWLGERGESGFREILAALPGRGYCAPFTVSHLPAHHGARHVLEDLGFRTRRRWAHMSLNLTASAAR